jgi:pyruvate dehydrogenase E2 component (dihydrolipoamide acetyltransferase)
MAVEVTMPRLGWGGEDGSLVEWIKKDGEPVQPGDVICTVEGDKAVNEVESLDAGILAIPPDAPVPGVKVPVGTVLAYLLKPGEQPPFAGGRGGATAAAASGSSSRQASVVADAPAAPAVEGRTDRSAPSISPRARRIAGELGVDWLSVVGSGRTGRIVERDIRAALSAAAAEAEATRISPVARRAAQDLGVDVEALARAKPGQRISRADVEAAARAKSEAVPPPAPAVREVPMGSVRRVIARRMAESAHAVAPVTLTTEVDATDLVRLRDQLKRDRAGTELAVPTYNDLLAKVVATALATHPHLNASLQDDAIVIHPQVNVGLAVDTERGLLVPVVRDVGNKSVVQIAQDAAGLTERARAGRATSGDLSGGTFTITNLGMYEIDAFTPIVNLPETAILGVGRIVAKPVVVDEAKETIAVRRMLALSLTFDHRLVDGAPAARFLQEIKRLVERPTLWLL